ncbi:hypothetical protein CYY_002404 [Polysphondylium violaceum]|uniref:Phosphatidylserine decarboxylase proenzyme 2 n=1 Tax=Polysphondylium violaceum TaxID=133409 RepID=A0A8J4V9N2_9MYCE|nr:hypothetical protein CYY_002404 [Polysphondylium violaceum]
MDEIIGVLSITIVDAKDLPKMDLNGHADPYTEIHFGGKKIFKTETIKKTLSPTWNATHKILIHKSEENYHLTFKVWDWDKATQNDFIGETTLDVKSLLDNIIVDQNYNIMKKEKERGKLHILSKLITKEEVSNAFWSSILTHFSIDGDNTLNEFEFVALITTLDPDYPEPDINLLFKKSDLDGDGTISIKELENLFFSTPEGKALTKHLLADNLDLMWEAYAVSDSFSTIADNIFHKDFQNSLKETDGHHKKVKTILVHNRENGKLDIEKIPSYIQVSLRVMYSTSAGRSAVNNSKVKKLMKYLTAKTGKKYNNPDSVKEIPHFIKFHELNTQEILDPLTSFKTFNEFFYRKLKPSARPVFEPTNPKNAVCPADCRLHVFPTLKIATELWIKGKSFQIASLIQDEQLAQQYEDGSLVIARLAPQDYHRFHVPVTGIIGPSKPIDGTYFTVNPIAIREDIDVYCENKRCVTQIDSEYFGKVLFISVGATLVGSINLTTTEGQHVTKGDEQGYFAFGGSTILLLFKKNTIQFDTDLIVNSTKPIETLVKVGTSLGNSVL